MSNVTETPSANIYTPDANDRMLRLRGWATEFPHITNGRKLTRGQVALARRTSVAALEKAAVIAEAMPAFGFTAAQIASIRQAIAFEIAYAGVRDEAKGFANRVDMEIIVRKDEAVQIAHDIYAASKGFVKIPAGDGLQSHIGDMKRTLVSPRRRKAAAPPAQEPVSKQK